MRCCRIRSPTVATRQRLIACVPGMVVFCSTRLQEIAFKEKRTGDARDSWYIREGFEGLLEEGLGVHYPPGEALLADDRAKVQCDTPLFPPASKLQHSLSCS